MNKSYRSINNTISDVMTQKHCRECKNKLNTLTAHYSKIYGMHKKWVYMNISISSSMCSLMCYGAWVVDLYSTSCVVLIMIIKYKLLCVSIMYYVLCIMYYVLYIVSIWSLIV